MVEITPVLRPRAKRDDPDDTMYGVWFYLDEIAAYDEKGSKLKNFFKERFNTLRPNDSIVRIEISKEDYERYFAPNVGTSQVYADYTVKPPQGRRVWLKERLQEQSPEPKTLQSVKKEAIRSNDAGTEKGSLVGWGVDGRRGGGVQKGE